MYHFEGIGELSVHDDFLEGARNAINVCLNVKSGEKVIIIADENSIESAAALAHTAEEAGAELAFFVLENHGARPMKETPKPIISVLEKADVSIFTAAAHDNELAFRMQLIQTVEQKKIRHAHMVNLTDRIMREGMRADYTAVNALSRRLFETLKNKTKLEVKSPGGAELVVDLAPDAKWGVSSGIIGPGRWGNLPGGELFVTPLSVNGLFVVDGVLGDFLGQKYGSLEKNPVYISIDNSRVAKIDCSLEPLVEDLFDYLHTGENADQVVEFSIGTNTFLKSVTGNMLQDEKLPTVHLSFGRPNTEQNRRNWRQARHIDGLTLFADLWADGKQIMDKGRFLLP